MTSAPEGILFVATGATYLTEAAEAARASRDHAGGRPISVVTDDVAAAEAMGCFDRCDVHPDPRGSYRDKIPALIEPPYERTLYLDTDARLVSTADPLFSILDEHDFAAAHAPVRTPSGWCAPDVPSSFTEYNSGVISIRTGARQRALVERWLELYDDVGQAWDQATLRAAVWASLSNGLRSYVLPPEANLRTTKPWVAGKGVPVTVVHGRVPQHEWPALLRFLNDDIDRFRTNAEWMAEQPDTALTPIVAGSRNARDRSTRRTPTSAGEISGGIGAVRARWSDANDERLPCEDPIFILSAGWRTGSTLLQRMLCADPSTMIWGEPHDRAQIIQRMADQWRPFTTQWPKESHQAGIQPDSELANAWIANLSPPVLDLRRTHRVFFDQLFGEPARRGGRTRWGVKEVRLGGGEAVYLDWLFPRAKFLVLVRDPVLAYASYKPRGPWFSRWPDEPVRGASAFARHWTRLAEELHAFTERRSSLLLRYEDLGDAAPRVAEYTGAPVARPQDLTVERGHSAMKGNGTVGVIERRTIERTTRRMREVLGYGR